MTERFHLPDFLKYHIAMAMRVYADDTSPSHWYNTAGGGA